MNKYKQARLESLRSFMKQDDVDAVLLYGRTHTQYFSGFTGSTSFVLITDNRAIFLSDSRYTVQATSEAEGFECFEINDGLLLAVSNLIKELKVERLAFDDDAMEVNIYEAFKTQCKNISFIFYGSRLTDMRRIKDSGELAKIKKAVDIADEAYARLLPQIKIGMSESQIAAQLEFNMKSLGASKPSFDTIAAIAERAALPHAQPTNRCLQAGDLMLLDFGALYEGYCSDITRVFCAGHVNKEMLPIYELVLKAQEYAEQNIKAGMKGYEVHELSASVIREAGYGDKFKHGLGHSLGLDIHENPRFSPMCKDVIEIGQVMTVEPGVYIEGLGGVRIEDTGVIEEAGFRALTRADKSLQIVDPRDI